MTDRKLVVFPTTNEDGKGRVVIPTKVEDVLKECQQKRRKQMWPEECEPDKYPVGSEQWGRHLVAMTYNTKFEELDVRPTDKNPEELNEELPVFATTVILLSPKQPRKCEAGEAEL